MNSCTNITNHCKKRKNPIENQAIKSLKNLSEVIKFATNRENLFNTHTRGISQSLFNEFANELLKLEIEINKAQNFHELIKIVRSGKVRGIGDLNIYDIAIIIGKFRKLYPEMIYLHAGTKEGAKTYFGNQKYKKIVTKEDGFLVIKKEYFLPKFKDFSCDELESNLCVTKGNLDEIL